MAYIDHDAITVFCEDAKTYQGDLDPQGNMIAWRNGVVWYRNLRTANVQRLNEGVGIAATGTTAAPTAPEQQNATSNATVAATPATQTTQAASTNESTNAGASASTTVSGNQDTEMTGREQAT